MNTNTPGTALDRGLNDLRIRQDALEERNADLESRVAALEGVSPPVDPGREIEVIRGDSSQLEHAIEKAAPERLAVRLIGECGLTKQVETDKDIHLVGDDSALLVADSTNLGMWDGQIHSTGRRCTVDGLRIRGHRRKKPNSRSAVFHFPKGVDLWARKVDCRDITGAAFQVREQKQPILIESSHFEDMHSFFPDGRETLGYGLALYGDPNVYADDVLAWPLGVMVNCTAKNVRHPVSVHNGGRAALIDNVFDNSANNLNAAVIDAHSRQGRNWKAGARFVLALRTKCMSPWYGAGFRGGQCWAGENDFTECGRDGVVALWNEDTNRGGPIDRHAPSEVHVWDHIWNGDDDDRPVRLRGLPQEMWDRVAFDKPGRLPAVLSMIEKQIAERRQ